MLQSVMTSWCLQCICTCIYTHVVLTVIVITRVLCCWLVAVYSVSNTVTGRLHFVGSAGVWLRDKNRRLVQPLLYTDLYRWHSPICTNATGDEHGGCIRGIGYPRPSSAIPYTTDKCPLILNGIIGFNRA